MEKRNKLTEKIYLIDIETCGLTTDYSIIEFSMVLIDLERNTKKHILNFQCQESYNGKKMPKDCWIFENTSLTYNKVKQSIPFKYYIKQIKNLLKFDHRITAYNQAFDFGFLVDRGILIPEEKKFPDPMIVLTPIMKLPFKSHKELYYEKYKWPSVVEAYKFLFGKSINEPHRAYFDTVIEANIIIEMNKRGYFV